MERNGPESQPNPFDPATNPNVEFVPFEEDPSLLAAQGIDEPRGRLIALKLRAYIDAKYQAEHYPGEAAQQSVDHATAELEDYLRRNGLRRSVREKLRPEE